MPLTTNYKVTSERTGTLTGATNTVSITLSNLLVGGTAINVSVKAMIRDSNNNWSYIEDELVGRYVGANSNYTTDKVRIYESRHSSLTQCEIDIVTNSINSVTVTARNNGYTGTTHWLIKTEVYFS